MNAAQKSVFVRGALAWGVLLISVCLLGWWVLSRDQMPERIILMTGVEGGLYHQFGSELKPIFEARTGRKLQVVSSEGSAENRAGLDSGAAHFAIVQSGAVELDGVALLSALYPEVVHVLVRKDGAINTVGDLSGAKIILGPDHSGMRRSAQEILNYYELTADIVEQKDRYFTALLEEPEIDGAIVTTGIFNPDLGRVLNSGEFKILPVDVGAALQMRNRYFHKYQLPKGVYGVKQTTPPVDVPTVATTALLVGGGELPKQLVEELLGAIFEGGLHYRFPTLFKKKDVIAHLPGPLVREADLFFNPADRLGYLANVMESAAAFKELAIALIAGLYLLWGRFKRFEQQERARTIQEEKDELDALLIETLEIEEAQVHVSDVGKLNEMLDEVTRIKLKALTQLTHEDLRGDRVFLIFITQCANLINKIQAKMNHLDRATGSESQ